MLRRPQLALPGRVQQSRLVGSLRRTWRQLDQWRYFRLLYRRGWLIALTVLLFLGGAFYRLQNTTPLYRSSGMIQIDPEDPDVLPYEEVSSPSYTGKESEEYLMTQTENLKSRALAERVVARLELDQDPRFQKLAKQTPQPGAAAAGGDSRRGGTGAAGGGLIESFLANLETSLVRKTRLVEIKYTFPDPEFAARVVDTVIEEFIALQLDVKQADSRAATEFLQTELAQLEQKIQGWQSQLVDFSSTNNADFSDGGRTSLERMADLSKQLTIAESELAGLSASYRAASGASPENFPPALENESIQHLERRLFELQRERANLSARYGPQWPAVRQVELEIEQIDQQLAAEKQEAINLATYRYREALERRQRLADTLERQRQVIDRFNRDSISYGTLERQIENNQELYEKLHDRLLQTSVEVGLRSSNIRVVAPANVPLKPAYPNKAQTLLLALAMGTVLGIGLVLGLEVLDDTVRDAEDVGQLGLPAIGLIPAPAGAAASPRQSVLAAFPEGRDRQLPALGHGVLEPAEARYWEAFRSLRSSLLRSERERDRLPRVVLITSALPGEGKTTTVVHMAIVLARTGAPTLMVDLDLRQPSLAQYFNINGAGGLSSFLAGRSELMQEVRATGIPNLSLLPAGTPAPDSVDLIDSGRMELGLAELRQRYAYVLIDSPSLEHVTDALSISHHADSVLLVVEAGKTTRSDLQAASDLITRAGARILGVVVNHAAGAEVA